MTLEELLTNAKKTYDNGGDKEDIYDLLLDTSEAIYPLLQYKKYVSIDYEDEEKLSEIAAEKNISYDELIESIIKESDKQCTYRDKIVIKIDSDLKKLRREKTDYFEYKVNSSTYFLSTTIDPDNELRYFKSQIKLYFNIPFDKIQDFFTEYSEFAAKNKMFTYFKTRFEKSTDMVTLRFRDIDKFDEVIEIINKYKEPSKTNPFIDTYDGIGYTLDNGESYNNFLRDLIYDYVSTSQNISTEGFIEFIKTKMKDVNKPEFTLDSIKKDAPYIFFQNLDNVINQKEFNLDDFKEKYQKLMEAEKNAKAERKKRSDYDNKRNDYVQKNYIDKLKKIGYENEDNMYEAINLLMSDTNKKCTISGQEMLVIDALKAYYKNEDPKSKLIEDCNNYLERMKKALIKTLDCKTKLFIQEVVLELAKLAINNEDDTVKGKAIASLLDSQKTIYTIGNYDMNINDIIKYYLYKNSTYKDPKKFLYDKTTELVNAFHIFDEGVGQTFQRNIKDLPRKLEYFSGNLEFENNLDAFDCYNIVPIYERNTIYDMLIKLMSYKYNINIDEETLEELDELDYDRIADEFMDIFVEVLKKQKKQKIFKK